ncbi:hypothetical protein D3C76_1707700 [compost metagenome]
MLPAFSAPIGVRLPFSALASSGETAAVAWVARRVAVRVADRSRACFFILVLLGMADQKVRWIENAMKSRSLSVCLKVYALVLSMTEPPSPKKLV